MRMKMRITYQNISATDENNGTDVALVGTYSDATTGAVGSTMSGIVFGEGFVQTFRP